MDFDKTLIGSDYLSNSYDDLKKHPDFSPHAYRIVTAIIMMDTKQLEQIDLIGGKNRGTK
jgi:hypothetical protein